MLHRRLIPAALGAVVIAACVQATPASAEGLFQALFGGLQRAITGSSQQHSYAPERDPVGNFFDRLTGQERRERVASAPTGGQRGFCVRTCDGSYFPMQSRPGLSAAEACSSFCPASPTQVFSGSTIDHAVARDGTRYADLPNAFVYRTKLIGGCTCNGKAAGGLASLDARTDPTLRPGDVVATNEGLMAFTAGRNKVANFTPVDQARFNKAERDKLAQMKVTPVEEDATGGIPAAWTDRADPGLRRTSSR